MKPYLRKALCGMMLVIALAVLTLNALAAGTTLCIVPPDKLPGVGETFTVQVTISGNPGLCSVEYTLSYDKSVVECQKVKLGSVLSDSVSAKNPKADSGAMIACAATDEMTEDGVMSEYTFKVLKSGEPAFALLVDSLKDADGSRISYTKSTKGSSSGVTTGASGTSQTKKEKTANPQGKSATQTGSPSQSGEAGTTQSAEGKRFSDIPKDFWAKELIEAAVGQRLMTGSLDGTFRPNQALTRSEFVSWLYYQAGRPSLNRYVDFEDVPMDAPYRAAVNWAAANGYAVGEGGYFRPYDKLTRAEMASILCQLYGGFDSIETLVVNASDPLARFTDADAVDDRAAEGMRWAVYTGIIRDFTDTKLNSNEIVNRAQAAAVFVRCAEKFNEG